MDNLFLIFLAGIWLIIASFCDLKKREIPNWLNFSLISFALAYRAFYSVLNHDLMFFIYGIMGLLLFISLAYIFYYGRIFAGGDAKLMMSLGAVLPMADSIYGNLLFLGGFVLLLLFAGGIYGIAYSGVIALQNRKKFVMEFRKQVKSGKHFILACMLIFIISFIAILYLQDTLLLLLPLIIAVFLFLFIYAKSVEKCMIIEISGKKATVGDWLFEEVRIGRKKIKPYWEGLSAREVSLIRKSGRKIKIKQGIPFVPSFLFAFILLLILRNSSWGFF